MSNIKDSIKGLFSQVFGRADFAEVLEDRWEYSETFEGEMISAQLPAARRRNKAPAPVAPTAEMQQSPNPFNETVESQREPTETVPESACLEPVAAPAQTLPDSNSVGAHAQPVETLPDSTQVQPGPPGPGPLPKNAPAKDPEPAAAKQQQPAPPPRRLQASRPKPLRLEPSTGSRAAAVPTGQATPASKTPVLTNSLNTDNLIAQIAFDSPNDIYPDTAQGQSALSGDVPSLSPESELGAILDGLQTTAVLHKAKRNQRKKNGPKGSAAPLLLVQRKESKEQQPAAPPHPDDEFRSEASTHSSRNLNLPDEEEDKETQTHIVRSARTRSPTLVIAYEDHAPLSSHDYGVLPPPPSEAINRSLIERVQFNLQRDLESLSSQKEEDIVELLLEALDNPQVDLPPFPAAARKLLSGGVEGPKDDDILDAVKSDPGLAGSVIRAANSPFYMAAAPVASLGSAVVRIGLKEVRRVALAAAMASSFDVKGFEVLIDSAHLHSLTTGTSAEALADTFSVEPGVAFLSGLLHNAGELLTYRLLNQSYNSTEEAPWHDRLNFVRELAVKYHCYLGALFIEPWDLPPQLQASLVYHHHPYMANEDNEDLASLMHVANAIAELATKHARSDIWREYINRLEKQRDATDGSRSSAGVDGVELISLGEVLEMLPPGFSKQRVHRLLRDILLRVAASPLTDSQDAAAATQY